MNLELTAEQISYLYKLCEANQENLAGVDEPDPDEVRVADDLTQLFGTAWLKVVNQ
jgi:hypothetical protein